MTSIPGPRRCLGIVSFQVNNLGSSLMFLFLRFVSGGCGEEPWGKPGWYNRADGDGFIGTSAVPPPPTTRLSYYGNTIRRRSQPSHVHSLTRHVRPE